ncbi:multidrug effflux MFS transporter, partial [Alphaproteobacteria bacterium]|nr:multidrug effflux MFS transporter [Alphaproteobacteria bacterium]
MRPSFYLVMVLLLGSLSAIPAISVDTILPAMPAMARDLSVDAGTVQLTLAAYIYGAATGQLLLAPLSDRIGRRPALFAGLILFITAGLGCCFATSPEMLAALRFIQGSSTYTGRVLPRAMARDMYDREDAARLISYMMVFAGLAPILAPLAGAYISVSFGWRAVFAFMVAYGGTIFLLTAIFLKETLPVERRIRINPISMAANFTLLVSNRVFLSYGVCVFLIMGALMAFLTSASSVALLFLNKTPYEFALASSGVMLGYMIFSFVAGRIVGRLGLERLIGLGSIIGAASGLTMLVLALAGFDTLWAIMVPMLGIMIALAFVVPSATAGAISPFGDMAGSAMANFGFIQTIISAI